MTEEPTSERGLHLGRRLQRVRLTRGASIVGVKEIIALGGSALVFVLVVISYLYFLLPARTQLQGAQSEKTRLQSVLTSYRTEVTKEQTTESTVRNITDSLDRFETEQLFNRTQGRMDLYGELNQLISKNAIRNTSGPTYTPLDPVGSRNSTSGTRSTNNKWQSIYPGIAISVTVEGQYANLRRFIHDIEASKLFVIINGVELERATDTHSVVASETQGGQARGSLVSLRVDMATYFQRARNDGDASTALTAQ